MGCAPLADVPCLAELPRLIRLKYLTPVNRWTHLDAPVARLRVATAERRECSLVWRAARIGEGLSGAQQDIAVTIEATSPAERMVVFGRAFGLSARQAELLGHLVAGSDTRDIAQKMFLSEHTVQDHLKSIFAKTLTRNRRTLLARAAGR